MCLCSCCLRQTPPPPSWLLNAVAQPLLPTAPVRIPTPLSYLHAGPNRADICIPEPIRWFSGGGHCDLLQGYDRSTGAKLAMKRIRVSGPVGDGESEAAVTVKRRISREAAIWHPLCHINVLTFLGVYDTSEATYLVSPWMELGDLSSFITSRLEFLRLSPGEQNELGLKAILYRSFKEEVVVTGIASGLAYLHANNVIHGDLKAANILLDDLLQPKICDFGLTKVLHSNYALTSKALKGAGSFRWMGPELLKEGENAVKTTASDVYAFGIMIAEPLPNLGSILFIAQAVTAGERPRSEPLSRDGQPFQDLWGLAASCWGQHPPSRPTADDIVAILRRGNPSGNWGTGHAESILAAVGAFRRW
ncbi:hypothetical protein FRB94_000696 [Tulasnella sp. JGI-2019a]|nr:hypothetical protein FRB94_000696 [Tulasnella sp. JGI-2019a]